MNTINSMRRERRCCCPRSPAVVVVAASLFLSRNKAEAFHRAVPPTRSRTLSHSRVYVSSPLTEEVTKVDETSTEETLNTEQTSKNTFLSSLYEKIGTVDDSRLLFPEYESGEVPRMFSSLEYSKSEEGRIEARHATGSAFGAAALVAGTTVGAGVLALPAATAAAGFLPSTVAMITAWIYMTMSGLLIAELTLNRIGGTGRPGLGLLELYESSLGKPWSLVGSAAYFFLHYAMMVAYIAQGGVDLNGVLSNVGLDNLATLPGIGQLAFAAVCGASLYAAKPAAIEKLNNVLVVGLGAIFLAIMGIGAGTADFGALVDSANQHPEQVVNCFPILFLALVYQNVVPTVVTQLEGDRTKITQAIVGGTTAPMLMFLAWNAVVLGNVAGTDVTNIDPVALLQSGTIEGGAMLGSLVNSFSLLAVTTSIIGFTYGLVDAWTDVFKINPKSEQFNSWKLPLFALVFGPPLALSLADPDIFYRALEYGGAFGVSTLFLVLPPIMIWKERYNDVDKPLVTKPMVPFGKLPLGSMWKAAATLIVEQGAEKLGVFDYMQEHFFHSL